MEVDESWRLFDKTGLPRGLSFRGPKKVISIEADGDTLIALDEEGVAYRYGHRFGYKGYSKNRSKYRRWSHKWGAPFKGTLRLPPHRAWSVGRNNDESLYHIDTAGNKINFGKLGLTHIYALSPDGRKIQYADTGLPPDFSRSFCGPERGSFQAVNISASGIVVLLINDKGDMYTKLVDYDTFGGTPFYRFYYGPGKKYDLPVGHAKAMHIPRRLPLPDWEKQPSVKGQITKKISIILTGEGPNNRELRVEGKDPLGRYGLFYKNIKSSTWKFKETGIFIDSINFLKPNTPKLKMASEDLFFEGNLKDSLGVKFGIKKIEIPNFHFSCSPLNFRVFLKNKSFSLKLHTVDSWTYYRLKNPELDDSSFKRIKGTLEIPPHLLDSRDPDIKKIIREVFLPYHLKTFKWAMVANQNLLKIVTEPLPENRRGLTFSFRRKNSKGIIHSFSRSAQNSSLFLKKGDDILAVIDRNERQRNKIMERREELRKRFKSSDLFYKAMNILKKPFRSFDKWFKNSSDKKLGNILGNITDHHFVLRKTSLMADRLALRFSLKDYYASLNLLDKRMCSYFKLFLKEKGIDDYFRRGPLRKKWLVGKRASRFERCRLKKL
jgi:hypothetical protein